MLSGRMCHPGGQRAMRSWLLPSYRPVLVLGVLASLTWLWLDHTSGPEPALHAAPHPRATAATANTGVDELLGYGRRARWAQDLRQRTLNGRTYTWEQYAGWGRELLIDGQVQQPPVGPAPA